MTQDSPALVIRTCDEKKLDQSGYYPLFKVNTIIKMLIESICTVWISGDRITIDESMIRYMDMGRNAALIQYMPQKPTNHGINVFAKGNGGLGCPFSNYQMVPS